MVLRDWKARKTRPGTEPTEEELSTYRGALAMKLGSAASKAKAKAANKGRGKGKARNLQPALPLFSNVLAARGLDRTLMMTFNTGLVGFIPQGRGVRPLTIGEHRHFDPLSTLPNGAGFHI